MCSVFLSQFWSLCSRTQIFSANGGSYGFLSTSVFFFTLFNKGQICGAHKSGLNSDLRDIRCLGFGFIAQLCFKCFHNLNPDLSAAFLGSHDAVSSLMFSTKDLHRRAVRCTGSSLGFYL
ncbi:hypothetical protein GOODEAATRI_027335 [Goodea atripinnis]|uniref:Uncharacterized protein n=1 Tax=Goodea atripinnis TaxID=208336 RepID=A0ABV0NE15_9TELE